MKTKITFSEKPANPGEYLPQPPAAGQAAHTPTFSRLEMLWIAAAITSCDERGFNRTAFDFIAADSPNCASLPHGDQLNALFVKLFKPESREAILRACNAHAGLVEALTHLEADATYNDAETVESLRARLDSLSESARAALAAAKEGKF